MPQHTGASPPRAALGGSDIFEDVKRRVDIFDIARRLGIIDRKRQARCPYPDHDDANPSFTLYRDTQTFHCFGCKRSGDATNLMRDFGGYATNYDAAVALLSGGYPAPSARRVNPFALAGAPAKVRVSNPDPKALLVAAWHYHTTLIGPRGGAGKDYLCSRGVTEKAISELGLGYSDGLGLRSALAGNGVGVKDAFEWGLFKRGDDDILRERFAGCVVVPDWDLDGNCRWLTSRRVDPSEGLARFESLPGSPSLLGARRLEGAQLDALFIVEGVFDFLALRQWGYDVVAFCGSPRIEDAVAGIEALHPCVVAFALDADEAGREVEARVGAGLSMPVVSVEMRLDAVDPGELLVMDGGAAAFAEAAAEALLGADEEGSR